MVDPSSSGSTGLDKKPFIPASRHINLTSSSELPVNATIGVIL
nr:hypothetical protein [Oleiphilus sp. HI0067]